jgi:hypothetical protein
VGRGRPAPVPASAAELELHGPITANAQRPSNEPSSRALPPTGPRLAVPCGNLGPQAPGVLMETGHREWAAKRLPRPRPVRAPPA